MEPPHDLEIEGRVRLKRKTPQVPYLDAIYNLPVGSRDFVVAYVSCPPAICIKLYPYKKG